MGGRGSHADVFVASMFVACLVTSNLTASKVVQVELPLLGRVTFPAAVLAYALTFLFTDVYAEVWGKRRAQALVMAGFAANLLMVGLVAFAVLLPPAPFHAEYQEAYSRVLGAAPGVVLASMVAYLASQTHDVWAFHWWRERTGGRWLWLRNNASTAVSQLIDTVTFITLAFAVVPLVATGSPAVPLGALPELVAGQYAVKLLIAACDTPLVYAGVLAVRRLGTGEG